MNYVNIDLDNGLSPEQRQASIQVVSSSGETRKFNFLNKIWPWRSRAIATQNNRDLNQAIFQLWSTFGDPSLNG